MRLSSLLSCVPHALLLSSLSFVVAAAPAESAKLTVLTPDNFEKTVSKGVWYVSFHCIASVSVFTSMRFAQVHRALFSLLWTLSQVRPDMGTTSGGSVEAGQSWNTSGAGELRCRRRYEATHMTIYAFSHLPQTCVQRTKSTAIHK